MSGKLAVFRCDASPAIGSGHVVRCLVLAEALAIRGWRTVFVCRSPSRGTVPRLAEVDVVEPPEAVSLEEEPEFLRDRLPPPHLLVVDHYGWSVREERRCRRWAGKVMVLDDLGDRFHDADLLLNQNAGWRPEDYRHRLPATCELLLGPRYAFVHPAFRSARARCRFRIRVRRILVAMGGTDPVDATGKVLAVLAESGYPGPVEIVLGRAAPALSRVRREVAARPGFRLHVDVPPAGMAALMQAADLAVAAAGSSSWERCCVGLPSIVSAIAGNQEVAARALAETGAALAIGDLAGACGRSELAAALRRLCTDPELRRQFRDRGRALVDGRGVERVARKIETGEGRKHAVG